MLRQKGLASSQTARRLAHVPHAYNIMRHITSISVERFVDQVLGEVESNIQGSGFVRPDFLSKGTKAVPPPPVDPELAALRSQLRDLASMMGKGGRPWTAPRGGSGSGALEII